MITLEIRRILDILIGEKLKELRLEDTRANRRKCLEMIRDRWVQLGDTNNQLLPHIKDEIERLREEMLQEQNKFGNRDEED